MSHDPDHVRGSFSIAPLISRHFGRWLLFAVIAVNIAAAIFCVLGLQNSRAHAERLAQAQAQNMAQALGQSIASIIDKVHLSTSTVKSEVERQLALGQMDFASVQRIVDRQKELTGFRVINANGDAIWGHVGTKNPTANIADRDYFIYLKQTPDAPFTYSKPLISHFVGHSVFTVAYRINRPDGSFAGVVTTPIAIDHFKNLMSNFDMGKNGVLVLRDHDLDMFLRMPEAANNVNLGFGSTPPTSTLRGLVEGGATFGTYRAIAHSDQAHRLFSYRKLPNAPIYVIAGLAEDDYLARWHRECWETLVFLLAFILVTTLSGGVLYRTWQRQLRDTKALHESHQSLKALVLKLQESDRALEATQVAGRLGIYTLNFDTGLFSGSPELDRILGLTTSDLHSIESWQNLIHPDDQRRMLDYFEREVVAAKQAFNQEYRIVRPADGATLWVQGFGTLEFDDADNPLRMSGTILDITARKHDEEELRLAHEVFTNMREAVIVTDENINIVNVNPAFSAMTGYSREEVIGKNPRILLHSDWQREQAEAFYQEMQEALMTAGYWEGEMESRRKDGTIYIQATKITAVQNGQERPTRFITVAADVTQLRAGREQMEHLAYHDKLTDLPNRLMLADRLQQAIAQAERRDELLGVCYLDLDGFKAINDTWGHDIGDEVLVEIAARLQSSIRAGDTVARLGGDEFIVLLGNATLVGEIELAIRRMLDAIAMPVKVGQGESQLTASIGVAIYPDDIDDADMLIRRADQAMYIAKRSGKNQFHLFDSEADRQLRAQRENKLRIVSALENNELRLHYQPKVDMHSGNIIGVEALIRWQHSERGLVLPLEFLPVIENTSFSIRLGEWVITQALRQMAQWSAGGLDMPVSVNLSGFHLQRPDFVERLSTLLGEYPDVNPKWLQLEILETSAMEDIEVVSRIITDCAELGVTFALDDFGTGYSSLTYFRRLPTQLMKIDRSFVRDMLNDPEDYALIASIVKLAQSFQRQVIAEGVETAEQGIALMRLGCSLVQGYYIARPMPPEAMPQWIRSWTMPNAWLNLTQNPLYAPE